MIVSTNNRNYIGYEISPKAHKQIIDNLTSTKLLIEQKVSSNIILGDSELSTINENTADMILTCPPYWDIEKYESVEGQLSDIKDYKLFLDKLKRILDKSYQILKQNKFMVIVCADFRKDKRLYVFHRDIMNICENIGFIVHDVIILKMNTKKSYLLYPQARYDYHTLKEHEYILVFKK